MYPSLVCPLDDIFVNTDTLQMVVVSCTICKADFRL